MKNKHSSLWYYCFIFYKVLIRNRGISFLLAFILVVPLAARSQTKLSATFENTTFKNALKIIEKETGYRFVYSDNVVPLKKQINLVIKNEDLSSVLIKLLNGSNIGFSVKENKIIALFLRDSDANVRQRKITGSTASFSGKVVDKLNNDLSGATIELIAETNYRAISNRDGVFTFPEIEPSVYTLKINYVGFEAYETKISVINNVSPQKFVLKAVENSLQEVVVVGYGEMKRRDLIGSVARINSKDIAKQPVGNVLSSLQGLTPGLEITNTTGSPGGAVSVRVRGVNSINAGNPLILVDNVPITDLGSIAPSDIESIEILKDASSTAIYGARGSNGVIIVTTKRGRTGKGQISLNAYGNIANPTKLSPVLNTEQYLMLRREGYKNDNVAYNSINAPDLFMDSTVNTNWTEKLYRSAPTYDYQLNFSGGSNDINYFFSGGSRRESAVISGDWFNERYNMRSGVDAKLSEKLTAGGGLAYTHIKENLYNASSAATLYYALPLIPLLDDNNQLNLNPYNQYINPNRILTSYNRAISNQLLGNLYFDYKFLKNLDFRTDLSFRNSSGKTVGFTPTTSSQTNDGSNYGNYGFSDVTSLNIEPKLTYQTKVGLHDMKFLAGGTYLNTSNSSTTIYTSSASNAIDELNTILAGTVGSRSYVEEPYKFASIFGRVNYKYMNRYSFEGVWRRDGSSRFGPDNKFGTFWSLGAGYIITDEPIFKNLLGEGGFAKIRVSYGSTGTDGIGSFRYLPMSVVTASGYMDKATISIGNLANPSLKWEETTKLDIGMDLRLLKNKLAFTFDYYKSRTNGMLYNDYLSNVTGFTMITRNMPGLVENRGFEFSLNVIPVENQFFKWTSSFNITLLKNKLVNLPSLKDASIINKYVYKEGEPLDLIWGFKYQGVDQETGLAKFEDVDNNGGINSYTPDYQVIGKRLPDFFGGWNNEVSYKRFDFALNTQFVGGIIKNYNIYSGIGDVFNLPISVLSRWRNPGDITDVPRSAAPGTQAAINNNKINQSDFAYDDASYVRVKNISIGYSFPVNNKKIDKLRLYATGYNLFTISNFKGDDPEGGSNVVPMVKMYTLGLNLTF